MPDVFIEHAPHHEQTHQVEKPSTGKKTDEKGFRHHRLRLFSSFVRDPMGVALAEQHEDEHILVFIRRAFVTNIPWLTLSFLLLLTPFFLPAFLAPIQALYEHLSLPSLVLLITFYYIIILGFIFANFLTWFYDIGIVTEKRAVDIDFYNISFISVATARAQDLKDVRYVQRGFFESLFDYGDVTLVVEASGETLTFENTPHPAEVVSILSALIGGHQE